MGTFRFDVVIWLKNGTSLGTYFTKVSRMLSMEAKTADLCGDDNKKAPTAIARARAAAVFVMMQCDAVPFCRKRADSLRKRVGVRI